MPDYTPTKFLPLLCGGVFHDDQAGRPLGPVSQIEHERRPSQDFEDALEAALQIADGDPTPFDESLSYETGWADGWAACHGPMMDHWNGTRAILTTLIRALDDQSTWTKEEFTWSLDTALAAAKAHLGEPA